MGEGKGFSVLEAGKGRGKVESRGGEMVSYGVEKGKQT